jgi:hypothetical protein
MTALPERRLLVALAGCLAAAGYGALKLAWGLDSTIGFDGPPPWKTGEGAWGRMSRFETFLALEGTALLALLAAAILLALLRLWRRALPRRLLRALAWLGAAVMLVPGVLGTASVVAVLIGLNEKNDPLDLWVFALVYGCFLVLGASLAAMAWMTRTRAAHESRSNKEP